MQEIADVLELLRKEGRRSILLVEQYLEFAREICDRFSVMDEGGLVLEGDRHTFRVDEVSALLCGRGPRRPPPKPPPRGLRRRSRRSNEDPACI